MLSDEVCIHDLCGGILGYLTDQNNDYKGPRGFRAGNVGLAVPD